MVTKQTYVYDQSSIVKSVGELKKHDDFEESSTNCVTINILNCEQYLENTKAE